jgi:PAS domain S-box-containing protein
MLVPLDTKAAHYIEISHGIREIEVSSISQDTIILQEKWGYVMDLIKTLTWDATRDEKWQLVTLTILTIFCIFLEIFMHIYLGVSVGYTHFFYVLLVLAAIWYQRKAVVLAVCLAATHLGIGFFLFNESLWAPLLRSIMFVIVTLLVGTLSEEHRQNEAALKESEKKVRALFDQTFQFIGLLTVDGTLIEANRPALEFSGVDASDVLGKPFWETPWWVHSPKQQEMLHAAVKKAAKGEFVRFEATHPAADGSLHNVDFSLKPVMDESGNAVFLIPEGRDITDQKKAEAALKASNERYLLYIKEAAMRLKTPVEVVEQNLAQLIDDIEGGDLEQDQVVPLLHLQVKNMEQIRQNIVDLNKTVVDGFGEITPASKKFLTE